MNRKDSKDIISLRRGEWKSTGIDRHVERVDNKTMKECSKHEKRPGDDDSIMLRICETCGRHYYVCDLCRSAKDIEAPLSICIRCAPSHRTMRNLIEKKDQEIHEMQNRIKKYEQEMKKVDEMKKQLTSMKKTNEELRHELKNRNDEITNLKRSNHQVEEKRDELSEELRAKDELSRDFKTLLSSQDYHDCIITSNGQKYQTHKSILAIRSPALKTMINAQLAPPTEGKKKSTNVNPTVNLDLEDIDPKMMPFFLNYIYTASTDGINDQNVPNVMKLADKYELSSLRSACLLFMENRLNKSTVIPILIEAYELNNERLKKKCMRYMQEQNIDLIGSPQWSHFKTENPGLALSLYERYISETTAAKEAKEKEAANKDSLTSRSQNNVGLNTNRAITHANISSINNPYLYGSSSYSPYHSLNLNSNYSNPNYFSTTNAYSYRNALN